jgi:hypothetical protein
VYYSSFHMDVFAPVQIVKGGLRTWPGSHSLLPLAHFVSLPPNGGGGRTLTLGVGVLEPASTPTPASSIACARALLPDPAPTGAASGLEALLDGCAELLKPWPGSGLEARYHEANFDRLKHNDQRQKGVPLLSCSFGLDP